MFRQDYRPYAYLECNSIDNYGIIILNYSLASLRNLLTKTIWTRATIRACADGGSNQLKIYSDEIRENFLPDYISGDFDSIENKTREFYENKSHVEFIETLDQNANDFTKCVRCMMEKQVNLKNLIVFCSLSGRFDHSIGNIHTLFLLNDIYPHLQIYLFTDNEIAFLLHRNQCNRIHIDSKYRGQVCSLLPFGQLTHVESQGLKWNLTRSQDLSFTKLVSSSNTYDNASTNYVDIYPDNDIIWTMTYSCDK